MTAPGWLHEKAVAMIVEACEGRYKQSKGWTGFADTEVYVRLRPGSDDWSGDLVEGVVRVKTPGEWDSIGGIVPDLILYGPNDTPRRVIEVIVTNPPDDKKRRKLDTLKSRGVDVVEVTVKSEADLLCLFPSLTPIRFRREGPWSGWRERYRQAQRFERLASDTSGQFLDDLSRHLLNSPPAARLRFVKVLQEVCGIDSLYPTPQSQPEQV